MEDSMAADFGETLRNVRRGIEFHDSNGHGYGDDVNTSCFRRSIEVSPVTV